MILFASDLDNTLIHSYKAAEPTDICVEIKGGKKLSYMSPEAYLLLKEAAEKCLFVPVTTRSLEQYERIEFGFKPRYAIIANGAVLLINGSADAQWISETRKLINAELPLLSENELIYDIRYVDDFFVFAKSDAPEDAADFLNSMIDASRFTVCAVHNKVYVFPKTLTKANAVKRLSERVSADLIICAGDSELDLSMAELADIWFFPDAGSESECKKIDYAGHILKSVIELTQTKHG